MKELDVKKANLLLRQRDEYIDALKSKFVKKVETETSWYSGSANYTIRKRMVAATTECKDVCEAILRNRAQECLDDINQQLKLMGVEAA